MTDIASETDPKAVKQRTHMLNNKTLTFVGRDIYENVPFFPHKRAATLL